jgi:hypothetical protein
MDYTPASINIDQSILRRTALINRRARKSNIGFTIDMVLSNA